MSLAPALTSPELTALAGPTTLRRYLKAVPATVVATARVNQNSFSYPLAAITVDTTSGWSGVREGMTVWIGTASGARDKGVYRVRKVPGATTLYVGEMGQADPGLLPVDLYNTLIADNDYVTVYQRYDIWSVLPRIVYPGGGTIAEDFDRAVGTNNTYPSPIVNVTINGKQGHYGKFITTANHGLTCTVSCTPWVSQTYTYAWSYPASWTGVSGASTATLTATAAPGDYTLYCTVTPNVGDPITAVRHIVICDASTNPPIYISELPQGDSRDRTGRRMTFSLYDNALASIPDGAMVIYWEEGTWNGGDVPTASTSFSGWVLRQTRSSAAGLRDATIEVVGPTGVLTLLDSTSQIITASATADTWQKVVPALSSAAFLAWYMLTWRAANVLRLFDFNVYATSATGQRLPEWRIDKGTLLQQVQQLATERGNFGANSAGSLFFLRQPSLIDYSTRTAAVVQRDTLTDGLYKTAHIEERRYKISSQIRGEAFAWDGSAAAPTPLLSDAPFVPGQGGAPQKLAQQVVDSQTTINQLTGDYLALVNNPYPTVTVFIEKNRDVYEPAELPFVTVTVPASKSPDGVQWSKRCIPLSVTKQHHEGTADISLVLEAETHGMAGITIAVPVANQELVIPDIGYPDIELPVPDILPPVVPLEPPVVSEPGEPDMRTDGSFAFGCTATQVRRTFNFKDAPPTYEDITPAAGMDYKMVLFDPASDYSRGAYVLGNDGTDSKVYYTEDIGATTVVWTASATAAGIYHKIVGFKGHPGCIMLDGIGNDVGTTDVTVTFDAGGWPYTFIEGSLQPTGGNPNGYGFDPAPGAKCQVRIDLPAAPRSLVHWQYDGLNTGGFATSGEITCFDADGNVLSDFGINRGGSAGWWTSSDANYPSWTTVNGVAYIYINIRASNNVGLDNIKLTMNTPPAPANATTLYSSTYGAAWGSPQTVGTSPGSVGGFDGTRFGPVTIAAAASQVMRATTLGGPNSAISGLTETARCLLIPWWQIGSNSNANNSLTAPDFLMGGSFGLDKVVADTASSIDPAVGATIEVANGLTSWKGKWLAALADVSGNRNLYVSVDTGVNWALIGGANGCAGALSVRVRRLANTPGQLIIACGANGIKYYPGSGTSLIDKAAPAGVHRSWEFFG